MERMSAEATRLSDETRGRGTAAIQAAIEKATAGIAAGLAGSDSAPVLPNKDADIFALGIVAQFLQRYPAVLAGL